MKGWFWAPYAAALLGLTLAGMEFISSFVVPTWPARQVRPISVEVLKENLSLTFAGLQDLPLDFNDWALRDRPRTFERPPGVTYRSVLVGDSFLEHYFAKSALPTLVEAEWNKAGESRWEAINFGVTATGPRQYFGRIKDVVLQLQPDSIVVMIYAGNDFISDRFSRWSPPPAVAELPLPSLLGAVAPRTTWLTVNRLGLSEVGRGNAAIAGEFAQLNEWMGRPANERLDLVVRHVRTHYYPKLDDATIREILSRGDGQLWRAADPGAATREYLTGWFLAALVDWETGSWTVPRDAGEADRTEGAAMVAETASWVEAMAELAQAHGIRFAVALAPTGVVDPDYTAFWKFWPRYFSYSLSSDARHRRLATLLRTRGLQVIDLRDLLLGQRDTYRLIDGHWTENGMALVADHLAKELPKLRRP